MIDVNQELKKVENTLRDLIAKVLQEKHGDEWKNYLGLSFERIKQIEQRKAEELKKRENTADKRFLYYSDFYDIESIITKNWNPLFKEIFLDKKTLVFYLSKLESFRNPHAHHRELFNYEEYLLKGIAGEILTSITKYHMKGENSNEK